MLSLLTVINNLFLYPFKAGDLFGYRGSQRWIVITLYGLALLPFIIVAAVRGADPLIIFAITLMTATLGIAFGSLHATLGLLVTLTLTILAGLNWQVAERSWRFVWAYDYSDLASIILILAGGFAIYIFAYRAIQSDQPRRAARILVSGTFIGTFLLFGSFGLPLWSILLFTLLLTFVILLGNPNYQLQRVGNWAALLASALLFIGALSAFNVALIIIFFFLFLIAFVSFTSHKKIKLRQIVGIQTLFIRVLPDDRYERFPLQGACAIMAMVVPHHWFSFGGDVSIADVALIILSGIIGWMFGRLLINTSPVPGETSQAAVSVPRVIWRTIVLLLAITVLGFGSSVTSDRTYVNVTSLNLDLENPTVFALNSARDEILAGNSDGFLSRWQITSDNTVEQSTIYARVTGLGAVTNLRYSAVESRFLAYMTDAVTLVDTEAGDLLALNTHGGNYNVDIAFTPDESLALAIDGNDIILWDTTNGNTKSTFAGHQNTITSVSLSPDGQTIVSSAADSRTILWDVPTGTVRIELDYDQQVTQVRFSPDGTTILTQTAVHGEPLNIWNAITGALVRQLPIEDHSVSSATYIGDGSQVVATLNASYFGLWDVTTGELIGFYDSFLGNEPSQIVSKDEYIYYLDYRDLLSYLPSEALIGPILPWLERSDGFHSAIELYFLPLLPPYVNVILMTGLLILLFSIARWHMITLLTLGLAGLLIAVFMSSASDYYDANFQMPLVATALVVGGGLGLLGGVWVLINPLLNQVLADRLRPHTDPITADSPIIEFVNSPIWINRFNLNKMNLVHRLVDREVRPEKFVQSTTRQTASDYLQTIAVSQIIAASSLEEVSQLTIIPQAEREWVAEAMRLRTGISLAEQTEQAAQLVNTVGQSSEIRKHLSQLIIAEFTDATRLYLELYAPLDSFRPEQLAENLDPRPADNSSLLAFRWQIRYILEQVRFLEQFYAKNRSNLAVAEDVALPPLREITSLARMVNSRDYPGLLDYLGNLISSLDSALSAIPAKRAILNPADTLAPVIEHTNPLYIALSALVDSLRAASKTLTDYIDSSLATIRDMVIKMPVKIDSIGSLPKSLEEYHGFRYNETMDELITRLNEAGETISTVQKLPRQAYRRIQSYEEAAENFARLQAMFKHNEDSSLDQTLNNLVVLLGKAAEEIAAEYERLENSLLDGLNSAQTLEQLYEMRNPCREATRMGSYPLLDEVVSWLGLVFEDLGATLNLDKNNYAYDLGLEKISERVVELQQRLENRVESAARRWSDCLETINHLIVSSKSGTVLRNPYIPGTVVDLRLAELFKGRGELAGQIAAKLRVGDALAFVLHGPRRMGKTSFLRQLPRLLPSEFVSVTFDAQRAGATISDSAFFYQLASEIYSDLMILVTERDLKLSKQPREPKRDPYYALVEPIEVGGSGPDDQVRLIYVPNPYAEFREWLAEEILPALGAEHYLFITIDEFENIGDSIEQGALKPRVLDNLRAIIQDDRFRQLRLMFAGVATIEQLAPPSVIKRNPFVNATSFPMTYLDRQSAINLICEPIPDKSRLPEYETVAVEEIVHLTHGQPFLIQALCSVLFTRINQTTERRAFITRELVLESIETVFEQYSPYFSDYWNDAGPDGQPILLLLVEAPDDLDNVSRHIVRELERRLIIERNSQGQYDFQIPLFREWVYLYES